ncbi:hypothetical protein ACSW82_04960 [Clostridium perfringens]
MNSDEVIVIGNDINGDYTISTVKPKYSKIFETAIMLTEYGVWHIVEKYKNEEDAIKGHRKYCGMAVTELDKII